MCKEDQTVTYEKAIEIWKRDGIHTSPVTPDEYAAVERLMLATWENKSKAANLKVSQCPCLCNTFHSQLKLTDLSTVLWT